MSLIPQPSVISSGILTQILRVSLVPTIRKSATPLVLAGIRKLSTHHVSNLPGLVDRGAMIGRPSLALQKYTKPQFSITIPGTPRPFSCNSRQLSDGAHITVKPSSDSSGSQTSIFLNEGKAYVDGKTVVLHPRVSTEATEEFDRHGEVQRQPESIEYRHENSDVPKGIFFGVLGVTILLIVLEGSKWDLGGFGHRHTLEQMRLKQENELEEKRLKQEHKLVESRLEQEQKLERMRLEQEQQLEKMRLKEELDMKKVKEAVRLGEKVSVSVRNS